MSHYRNQRLEQLRRMQDRRRRSEKLVVVGFVSVVLAILAFWVVVGYVILHFIAKWW